MLIQGQRSLVAMVHELGQVQDGLRYLWHVGHGQRLLKAADQLRLHVVAQLVPAADEGRVEEVPGELGVALGQREARS